MRTDRPRTEQRYVAVEFESEFSKESPESERQTIRVGLKAR